MIDIPAPAIFYPTGAAAARAVLPRLLGAGASFVKRRPILSGLGLLIGYEYFDENDEPLAQVDIPGADVLAEALTAAGIALVSAAEALGWRARASSMALSARIWRRVSRSSAWRCMVAARVSSLFLVGTLCLASHL